MPGPIYAEVVRLYREAYYPDGKGPTPSNAWMGIYEVLLTYEYGVPQVFDKDSLESGPWRRRAEAFESYLAAKLGISSSEVEGLVGRITRHQFWKGKQINNVRGHGFRTIVAHLLRQSGSACDFIEEAPSNDWFPGIHLPGASKRPRVDILATKNDQPRAIVSCKWTVRHDRVSDITNECPVYKAAAARRRLKPFGHYVVTAESNPARLAKMLDDDCLDGVVHVNTGALAAMGINGRTKQVIDLAAFIATASVW